MRTPNQNRRIAHAIIVGGIFLAGLILLVPLSENGVKALLALGAVTIFAGIGYGLYTVKCPHCHHSLPLQGGDLDYCPHCRKKL